MDSSTIFPLKSLMNKLVALVFTAGFSMMSVAVTERDFLRGAQNGDIDTVYTALQQGINASARSADTTTALQWAVQGDHIDIVELLLSNGADAKTSNRYGVTAAALAAENGNAKIMNMLLSAGVDPNQSMPEGETLLMTAARTGNAATVRMLLEQGANPNNRENSRGQTALMWAAGHNNVDAIRVMAEFNVNVNVKTDNPTRIADRVFQYTPPTGFSALSFAVRSGHKEATDALLDSGADINDLVSDGQSVLMLIGNWRHI